jgi:hypothetical protein
MSAVVQLLKYSASANKQGDVNADSANEGCNAVEVFVEKLTRQPTVL